MSHTLLIVDDEATIRQSLRGVLEDESYQVVEAASGEEGLELLATREFSLVLLDIWMEGIDGIETLRRIKQVESELPVIMMSGHGNIETAVAATKIGAYDFLEKPLTLDRLLLMVERALGAWELVRENRLLRERAALDDHLIGETPAMRELKEQIARVAPTNGWVLITGGNGTGKEVAARNLHELSRRGRGPFIPVNSAAIPEDLIESELFGHEKGAFPGATTPRTGRFEQANGGTLFLDEIGDMGLKTQAKILRLLQEQRFERMGGNRQIMVDVRVIAASNKKLEEEIATGRFRADLFYRLNVIPIHIPALQERLEDIPLLVEHFCKFNHANIRGKGFDPAALERLKGYHWPGNVRELRNLVERLLIMTPGNRITIADLPEFITHQRPVGRELDSILTIADFRQAREEFERVYLKHSLESNHGNVSRTADIIGMERSALHRKLKSLGLG